MYLGSRTILAPAFVVALGVALVGLIAAQTRLAPAGIAQSPGRIAAESDLPWSDLSEPPAELLPLVTLLKETPKKQQLEALNGFTESPTASARARGLAAFASGVR